MRPVRDAEQSARHTDTAVGEKGLPKSLVGRLCERPLVANAAAYAGKSVELENPVALHMMWKPSRKARPWGGGRRRWKEANAGL